MSAFLLSAARHFASSWTRIHPLVYAALALAGLLAVWQRWNLITGEVAPAMIAFGVVGLWLWWWIERRAKARLAIAQFETIGQPALSGKDIQRLVLSQLEESIPRGLTHFTAIPITLGRADSRRARAFALRSRASYVLFGDVTSSESGVAILPRLIDVNPATTFHADDATHDVLPVRLKRDVVQRRFSTQYGIQDVDYPMAFGTDLEGLVLALDGLVLSDTQPVEAVSLLERAIDHTQGSQSSAADQLYVERALVQLGIGQPGPALDSLRLRLEGHSDPSPALLRTHASVISSMISQTEQMVAEGLGTIDNTALNALREEAIESLRSATVDETDPLRDMSRYNLASILLTSEVHHHEEGQVILQDLATNSPMYRRAWYVHRAIGVAQWGLANAAWDDGDEAAATRIFSRAAASYSKAIRLRPRWQLRGDSIWLPIPPIMRANARDANQRAGNKLRARWQGLILKLRTGRLLRCSIRAVDRQDWEEAARLARLVIIGTQDDADLIASEILRAANEATHGAEDVADERDW